MSDPSRPEKEVNNMNRTEETEYTTGLFQNVLDMTGIIRDILSKDHTARITQYDDGTLDIFEVTEERREPLPTSAAESLSPAASCI